MADDYVAKMREAAARAAKGVKFTPTQASQWAAQQQAKADRRREQNRVNKAAQRARDKAGQAPSRAGPPRVKGSPAERAQAAAKLQRERRANALSQLPDVRNPKARIRVGEQSDRFAPPKKTSAGAARQAQAIREQAAAQKLQNVGRARQHQLRDELSFGPNSQRLREAMTPEQRARFQAISEKIADGSQQSTAILFNHAGGQGDYSSALERILASPESRDVDEGLAILENLAAKAGKAAQMYAPSKIGRLTV